MYNSLKFCQGAVARKDFEPALTHFHIHGGKVQAYNGILSLCGPIALDLDITPNAVQLVKAVRACQDTIGLSMTKAGRLAIKSGKFKAYVECYPGGFPEIQPGGTEVALPPTFLDALRLLDPCVAEDASRQWARGILFRGTSAFATNNVVLVEYLLGTEVPFEINIPQAAVTELLRINEMPTKMLVEETAVTFVYSGDRWLRTQLYTSTWPDLTKIFDTQATFSPSPLTLADIDNMLPFLGDDERLYLLNGEIATSPEEGIGARLEISGLPAGGIFNAHMLRLALERQEQIDFASYPKPCLFVGKNLRGAIIGMRPA